MGLFSTHVEREELGSGRFRSTLHIKKIAHRRNGVLRRIKAEWAQGDANTTGFYSEQIAVTTANGFEAGKSYSVRITGVVGGVTGVEVHTFDVSAALLDDGVAVASIAAGAITAAAIADDAIDAASLATDAVNEIVDQVWNEAAADHVTAGTTGKALGDAGAAGDPWAAATRTLTSSAAATVAAMTGSTLVVTRGVTYGATISGLTIPATWSKMLLTAKASTGDSDAQAQIQIQESVATTGDGLLYIHGNLPWPPPAWSWATLRSP